MSQLFRERGTQCINSGSLYIFVKESTKRGPSFSLKHIKHQLILTTWLIQFHLNEKLLIPISWFTVSFSLYKVTLAMYIAKIQTS